MQQRSVSTFRDAATSLIMAVLRDLAEHDGVPRIEPITDLRYWWRYGQESFVAVRPDAWHMPERATVVGWLDTFAEMAVVRAAVNADPVLCNRVDTMVGTEFSVRQRPLDALLLQHLLEPVVVASRAYAFDWCALFNPDSLYWADLDCGCFFRYSSWTCRGVR